MTVEPVWVVVHARPGDGAQVFGLYTEAEARSEAQARPGLFAGPLKAIRREPNVVSSEYERGYAQARTDLAAELTKRGQEALVSLITDLLNPRSEP